jgi:hypothetical protein
MMMPDITLTLIDIFATVFSEDGRHCRYAAAITLTLRGRHIAGWRYAASCRRD